MMQRYIIDCLIVLLSLICVIVMIPRVAKQDTAPLSRRRKMQLAVSGIIAFFMDTIGVGSFACNIALAKYFKTCSDQELPGMINTAQVIPGAIEAIFFVGLIDVDGLTLLTMIVATSLGGIFGASVISKLNTQALRIVMVIIFPIIIALILCNHFQWLPIGGDKTALHGYELIFGFIGLFVAGALTSAGVGLFAMVQAILFCLGVSPIVAFPIMNAAGALQQPLSTLIFVVKGNVPLKKSLLIGLYGIIGVLIALPIITHLNTSTLHFLLVGVLAYNTVMMGVSYLRHRKLSFPLGVQIREMG